MKSSPQSKPESKVLCTIFYFYTRCVPSGPSISYQQMQSFMNFFNSIYAKMRQRHAQVLINQIAALHPELDRFEGEAKIEYYMKSCFRYFAHQRNDETRRDDDFNESVTYKNLKLRHKALHYLSTRSAQSYHFDLLQAEMKIQDLMAENETLRIDSLIKDQVVNEATEIVKEVHDTVHQFSVSRSLEFRQN